MQQHTMRFKENADVFDENNEKVGSIDRVVIDPRSREVTHVVVRQGFLFTEDKVIPVEWLDNSSEDKVVLNVPEEEIESLPPFEETHFVPWQDPEARQATAPRGYAQPYYWYPVRSVYWWGYPAYRTHFGFNTPPYTTVVERNIPADTVALEPGADVISADDEHVGDVEQVFADSDSGHATHFVISQGLFFKDRKLIPTAWIDTLREKKVYLAVDSEFLNQLESYED